MWNQRCLDNFGIYTNLMSCAMMWRLIWKKWWAGNGTWTKKGWSALFMRFQKELFWVNVKLHRLHFVKIKVEEEMGSWWESNKKVRIKGLSSDPCVSSELFYERMYSCTGHTLKSIKRKEWWAANGSWTKKVGLTAQLLRKADNIWAAKRFKT